MEMVIGVEMGFGVVPSTAVLAFERGTLQVLGAFIGSARDAPACLGQLLGDHPSAMLTVCIGGPVAGPIHHPCGRLVERFFSSGPFAARPPRGADPLRLMPRYTRPDSPFLAATQRLVSWFDQRGLRLAGVPDAIPHSVFETFPTLAMASLLPPRGYYGPRAGRTDALWKELFAPLRPRGARTVAKVERRGQAAASGRGDAVAAASPHMAPYGPIFHCVENLPAAWRHGLRAAAFCAILADWCMALPPRWSRTGTTFIGARGEHGFLLPPLDRMDPAFASLLTDHWTARGSYPLLRL